jgi:hypothetical protein
LDRSEEWNVRIRKQVYELSPSDLKDHPIWEFALDEEGEEGQDEATVRPWAGDEPLDPAAGMFVVRAIFELADGTTLGGYLTPLVEGSTSIGTIQPIVVTDQGQVNFWCGAMAPSAEGIRSQYAKIGRPSSSVFPCRYTSDVRIVGGSVTGSINGFMHFRSLSDRAVVELK